mmetsp:Transcript_17542/g.42175  ORF Transcript_17542/g.42175 Transcript_17542/m.42175 type:complete len:242 (-) Transcript_17542:459-1184(-)
MAMVVIIIRPSSPIAVEDGGGHCETLVGEQIVVGEKVAAMAERRHGHDGKGRGRVAVRATAAGRPPPRGEPRGGWPRAPPLGRALELRGPGRSSVGRGRRRIVAFLVQVRHVRDRGEEGRRRWPGGTAYAQSRSEQLLLAGLCSPGRTLGKEVREFLFLRTAATSSPPRHTPRRRPLACDRLLVRPPGVVLDILDREAAVSEQILPSLGPRRRRGRRRCARFSAARGGGGGRTVPEIGSVR